MFYNQLVHYTKIEIGEAKIASITHVFYQPLFCNFELLLQGFKNRRITNLHYLLAQTITLHIEKFPSDPLVDFIKFQLFECQPIRMQIERAKF